MKRFFSVISLFVFSFCLISCSYRETYDDGYEEGYADGYYEGQCAGYYEGIDEAKRYIAFVLDDDLSSLSDKIEADYGLSTYDALNILSNYYDVPEEVTEEELNLAILVICLYCYDFDEVINGIEDYWIE
mgnify:CR=1 FL=1